MVVGLGMGIGSNPKKSIKTSDGNLGCQVGRGRKAQPRPAGFEVYPAGWKSHSISRIGGGSTDIREKRGKHNRERTTYLTVS
jgi:hypothetical protein